MLVHVGALEIAPDGAAGDHEVACSPARTGHSASLHPPLHGRGTGASRGVRHLGHGLLHLRVGAQGGAPGALGGVFGDHNVRAGRRAAADGGGDLHTTGGFP